MTPKSSTERSDDRRKRLKALGYKEIRNLWVLPECEQSIRDWADFLDQLSARNMTGEYIVDEIRRLAWERAHPSFIGDLFKKYFRK